MWRDGRAVIGAKARVAVKGTPAKARPGALSYSSNGLGSISYLDSKINSGTTAGGNPAGAALPLIPEWSGNLFTNYRFASGATIGGGFQYSGEVARRELGLIKPGEKVFIIKDVQPAKQ